MGIELKVTGLKELSEKLKKVSLETRTKTTQNAVSKAGGVILKTAKELAPVLKTPAKYRTKGLVKVSIKKRTKVYKNKAICFVYVPKVKVDKAGAKSPNDPYYARWLEYGTVKMRARPFMRPAMDINKDKAVQTIIAFTEKELKKYDLT